MAKRGFSAILTVAALSLVVVGIFTMTLMAEENARRVTKEELIAMLGTSDVVLVDVRTQRAWDASDAKIRGAIRWRPDVHTTWSREYSKDQTLVLYCE